MLRRSLPPLLLVAALVAPAGAQAQMQRFDTRAHGHAEATPKTTLRKAEAIVSGDGPVRDGYELTPLLKELAVALPELGGSTRARARALLARPTQGESAEGEPATYAVPEHDPPFCSAHFCVHWVDSTDDAPSLDDVNGTNDGDGIPDYVETTSAVFERVYDVENLQLGWREPVSDGAGGCPGAQPFCLDRTDVYLADLGGQGIYGYAAADPGQRSLNQSAFLVLDDDYSAEQFRKYEGNPIAPLEVTAAHEYNHVLQYGYDVAQDTWMFESTAVWMEEKVYPQIDDYLQYLEPWSQLSFVPLTHFNSFEQDPLNLKAYGGSVWNAWIDRRYGQETVRRAWEHSLISRPKSFAPGAYDGALRERGSGFFDSFTRFAVDTAEWRAAGTPFPEGASYPDMVRVRDARTGVPIQLRPNQGGAGGELPHTTFGLLEVAPTQERRIKMVITSPRGVQTAVGLVGRTGDETGGRATVAMARLPRGGTGTTTLENPGAFSRLTGVIVNGDGRTTGRYSRTFGDWEWKGDGAEVSARISTDFTAPIARTRSPRPGARRISRRPKLTVSFSEPMMGVDATTVDLLTPGGGEIPARISQRAGDRRIEIRPRPRLRPRTRYRVRLGANVTDRGGNLVPRAARSWSFTTRR